TLVVRRRQAFYPKVQPPCVFRRRRRPKPPLPPGRCSYPRFSKLSMRCLLSADAGRTRSSLESTSTRGGPLLSQVGVFGSFCSLLGATSCLARGPCWLPWLSVEKSIDYAALR